jgi:MFS family permease
MIKKVLLVSSGSFLQWFDNTLFQVLIPLIIFNFVPSDDNLSYSFTLVMAYSASLFTRPFGAIIFGHLSDHFGRKKILLISPFVAGISMLFLAICPSVTTVGVAAPAFLLLFTFLHGFSSGAEWPVSSCYLFEKGNAKSYAISSLILVLSLVVGIFSSDILLGSILFFKNPNFIAQWFWRLIFLFSATMAFLAVYLRRMLPDEKNHETHAERFSAIKAILKEKKALGLTFFFCAIDGVGFNVIFNDLFPFGNQVENRAYSFISIVIVLIFCWGIYKFFKKLGPLASAKLSCIAFIVISLVFFKLDLSIREFKLLFSLPAFMFLLSTPILLPSLFQDKNRAFLLAISRSISIFVFGGLGLIFIKWKMSQDMTHLAYYVLIVASLSLLACYGMPKKLRVS